MLTAGSAVGKIFAASYAHNQLYYHQSTNRPSGWPRSFLSSEPVNQYYKAAASGIALVLKAAKDMKSSSQNVLKPDTSAFHARTAVSSDKTSVTASASQKSTTVSAFISSGDTNGQALTKLRDSINEAHTGVIAGVVTDAITSDKKLELTSAQTGTKNAFTVTDVAGNAAATTGIGNEKTAAADAVFSANGGASITSSSNVIEVRPDEAGVLKQVKQMISDYNTVMKRVSEAGTYLNPSVKRSLGNSAGGHESIGITKRADGTLELDETKFKSSLSSGFEQTRDAISGPFGLAAKLSQAADSFENVPPHAMLNSRVREMQSFAAYQSSAGFYLQLPTSGLLFDGIF